MNKIYILVIRIGPHPHPMPGALLVGRVAGSAGDGPALLGGGQGVDRWGARGQLHHESHAETRYRVTESRPF